MGGHSLGNVITFEEIFDNQFNPSIKNYRGDVQSAIKGWKTDLGWQNSNQTCPKSPPASAVDSQRDVRMAGKAAVTWF